MNTSKLHVIAKALKKELSQVKTVSLLEKVIKALQQQIQQPQQSSHQQQLSQHLNELFSNLENSSVDEYSPAWRDAMDELNVSAEFGKHLEKSLRATFEKNQITPQTALEEMQSLHEDISGTESNLDALVRSLEYFSVGEDELEPNECEVGIVVPRRYVNDNLRKFGAELVNLEKTLLVFSELATGSRKPLGIRQISSSELSVSLEYVPEIGACVAIAVERITALHKQLLEIKKLKSELKAQDVPDESLEGIEKHARSVVEPKLEKLALELMEKFGGNLEQDRAHEVSIELRHSLNKLANRIDRGFNIELRVAPPEPNDTDNREDGAVDLDPNVAAKRQIIASASKIDFLEHVEAPILMLPENDDNNED